MGKKVTLYKTDVKGKVREWTIEVEGNAYRTVSGLIDGEKVISEWSYAHGKNTGKSNATTDEEQALKIAETLIRIRKEQGCHETIEEAGKGKAFFQPMLASKWESVKSKVDFSTDRVFIQQKLDGCRCIVTAEGMFSRNGKEWISAPHIFEKLKPVFEKNPDLILDGELYYHSSEDNFNEVISLVKKKRPTQEDLEMSAQLVQYWIYDLPSDGGTFSERYLNLQKLFRENPEFDQSFVLVETLPVPDESFIYSMLEEFVSRDYEGAIVRLDAEYECKRSKNLLKVKKFEDEEFTIVDIEEGRGNLAGKAGRIIVDVDGNLVRAGLKFSHSDAAEIWTNRYKYIGKKATIKYFNRTPDGSLRFPKCIQIDRASYE